MCMIKHPKLSFLSPDLILKGLKKKVKVYLSLFNVILDIQRETSLHVQETESMTFDQKWRETLTWCL